MKIKDAALIMCDKLTVELKSLIQAEGHVKTGFMLKTSEIKFLSHLYDGKIRFIFSIKAPYYFNLVEARRLDEGSKSLLQLLKSSTAYRESLELFTRAIIEEFGQSIIADLTGKKAFKETLKNI